MSSSNNNSMDSSGGYGWADALPAKQGLYDPANERDACGVGFIVNIKGVRSHKLLRDSEDLLRNMSHRGATGADERDGDGAGVMAALPHEFMVKVFGQLGCTVPEPGEYATGNVFLHPDTDTRQQSQSIFDHLATEVGLQTVGWRAVPTNSSILGPSGQSKEPVIMQPLVVSAGDRMEETEFTRRLFMLRKRAQHTIGFKKWFYVCSLATRTIVYKGQLTPAQVPEYYADLRDSDFVTHFALVHSRFSTNTFPSWERAQPFNLCAHNGEINTLRGNKNWMRSREGQMQSEAFGKELQKAFPIIDEFGSDSAAFDSVLELLVVSGTLTMAEAVMVMVPEAWQNNKLMGPEKRAFYEWASCVMEPWDGPALFTFSDGRFCGASLDRNGLRPCRYYVTNDDRMICASEVGAVSVAPETVVQKGRLMPGRMLLVDTEAGTIVDDEQLKLQYAQQYPFQQWIGEHQISLDQLAPASDEALATATALDKQAEVRDQLLKAFGYSGEQLAMVLGPMAAGGKEALGSMGNDSVLACLDAAPRLPYEYFRQLFAQVTNPPIDPIRERLVMSLQCPVGPEGNLLEVSASQTQRLTLESPVLTVAELEAIRGMSRQHSGWTTHTIDVTFPVSEGAGGYERTLDRACAEAQQAISEGARVLVVSDRGVGAGRVAASALLAVGAVHHALVGERLRARVALLVETAEARETHHVCVLVGHGADAVCPYLAYAALAKLHSSGVLADKSVEQLIAQYRHALDDGLLKVMSKMGISTLQSYKGAQCFEALGIASDVVERCFTGTASRIEGTTLTGFAADALARHAAAYGAESGAPAIESAADVKEESANSTLGDDGEYAWRRGGSKHVNTPVTVSRLQDAVRTENKRAWDAYVDASQASVRACTLRGQLELALDDGAAVPIDEVEPWTAIVKRFCTGAMSYGSISIEAHTALALAMNKIGGKSNSGEGGEDASRS
ncbi:glutamate synthase [NADH], partial [Coemansia sp. RSA 2603]